MCRGCHCKSSLPLILKKLNNFPVLHGVLQINVMITLAWGGMWENTPGAAPFPCESFPSELAITQQLAGVREREAVCGPQPQKAWGFPCVWQGCVTSGATCTILSLCLLGKQCVGVPLLSAATQAEYEGQPHT